MALGDYNNNNNNSDKSYSPTVYGPVYSNPASELDATRLSVSYWKTTMKISIAAKIDEAQYDNDNAISIYINHTKALILASILRELLVNPEKYQNGHCRGVESPQGIITVSDGSDFGKPGHPCIVIRKITDDGVVTACSAYEFKRDWFHSIDDYDQNEKNKYTVNTEEFADIEINEFINCLEDYARAMNMTTAFSVAHSLQYCGLNNIINNQYKIAGKLGVDLTNGKYGSGRRSGGYFNNNGGNQSNVASGYHNTNVSTNNSDTDVTLDDLANM